MAGGDERVRNCREGVHRGEVGRGVGEGTGGLPGLDGVVPRRRIPSAAWSPACQADDDARAVWAMADAAAAPAASPGLLTWSKTSRRSYRASSVPVNCTGPHPYRASEVAEAVALVADGLRGSWEVRCVGSRCGLLVRFPTAVVFAEDVEDLGPGLAADRDGEVLGAGQRAIGAQHRLPGPFDQLGPHRADQDERGVVQLPHLEQLPDHHRLQHRADPARHDDEGVRDEHEMVQPREERAVLEDLADERVDVLLERQFDPDADGRSRRGPPRPSGPPRSPPASARARRR